MEPKWKLWFTVIFAASIALGGCLVPEESVEDHRTNATQDGSLGEDDRAYVTPDMAGVHDSWDKEGRTA